MSWVLISAGDSQHARCVPRLLLSIWLHLNCSLNGLVRQSSLLSLTGHCRGMHAQLLALQKLVQLLDPPLHAHLERHECLDFFFTYRWLLILFKREFTFDEVRPAAGLVAACCVCNRSRTLV